MEKHPMAFTKFLKTSSNSSSSSSSNSTGSGLVRGSEAQKPFRLHSRSSGTQKNQSTEKSKACSKNALKEQSKPLDVTLHTQLRSIKRAGFNYLVAYKTTLIERQKREAEKLQKMIEEEEIRRLRKEMIPRAQLMPIFDRPFFPQRSTRPLTIPREPRIHNLNDKCCRCISCRGFAHFNGQARKAIK